MLVVTDRRVLLVDRGLRAERFWEARRGRDPQARADRRRLAAALRRRRGHVHARSCRSTAATSSPRCSIRADAYNGLMAIRLVRYGLPAADLRRRRRARDHRRRRAAGRGDRADRRGRARRARERDDAALGAERARPRARRSGAKERQPARLDRSTDRPDGSSASPHVPTLRTCFWLIGIAGVWIFCCLMAVALCAMPPPRRRATRSLLGAVPETPVDVDFVLDVRRARAAASRAGPRRARRSTRLRRDELDDLELHQRGAVGDGALLVLGACAWPRVNAEDSTQARKCSSVSQRV